MKTGKKSRLDAKAAEAPAPAIAEAAAYAAATRLLCRRGHSRHELGLKLRQRGYEQTVIDAALARCERHNYLDDTAACEHYCRELVRKGQGPRAIRQRLAQRGFDRALVEATLEAHYPVATIHAIARAVACRKANQLKVRSKGRSDLRARLVRFLTQRGFPADVVHEAIEIAIEAGSHTDGAQSNGR